MRLRELWPTTPSLCRTQTLRQRTLWFRPIKQAVQDVDGAQVKAVSSRDLSGLAAGATNEFAAQQKAVAQGLIDDGVVEIKLMGIEWGPIKVNGSNATVTAFETWAATYADGLTEQSREHNTYTLVQQQGKWNVQSDELERGLPDARPGQHWMPHLSTPLLAAQYL